MEISFQNSILVKTYICGPLMRLQSLVIKYMKKVEHMKKKKVVLMNHFHPFPYLIYVWFCNSFFKFEIYLVYNA